MSADVFSAAVSRQIWDERYRWRDGGVPREAAMADTWLRVARAAAACEREQPLWAARFYSLLANFGLLPGGRILAGALALEKGAFTACDPRRHAEAAFVSALPEDIVARIRSAGLRNSHLLAIAPAGTISLLANNVSSGIEPVFGLSARRRIRHGSARYASWELDDYAWARWRDTHPGTAAPAYFRTARDIPPADHLAMQAVLQPFVDQAIAKTINVARNYPFDAFQTLYREAHRLGLKGCTAYRPNPVTGAILSSPARPRCGGPREGVC